MSAAQPLPSSGSPIKGPGVFREAQHASCCCLCAGALVISTGDARIGARGNNTGNASTNHKTNNGDADLQSVNSKIYSQPLTDVATLSFDIVPTVSGEVYFRCVVAALLAGCCTCVCGRGAAGVTRGVHTQLMLVYGCSCGWLGAATSAML